LAAGEVDLAERPVANGLAGDECDLSRGGQPIESREIVGRRRENVLLSLSIDDAELRPGIVPFGLLEYDELAVRRDGQGGSQEPRLVHLLADRELQPSHAVRALSNHGDVFAPGDPARSD